MPSHSLQQWMTARASELDEIESAHRMVGGTGRGRKYATQQLNRAYATLLSSQFQGFCRDLYSETHRRAWPPAVPGRTSGRFRASILRGTSRRGLASGDAEKRANGSVRAVRRDSAETPG